MSKDLRPTIDLGQRVRDKGSAYFPVVGWASPYQLAELLFETFGEPNEAAFIDVGARPPVPPKRRMVR